MLWICKGKPVGLLVPDTHTLRGLQSEPESSVRATWLHISMLKITGRPLEQ